MALCSFEQGFFHEQYIWYAKKACSGKISLDNGLECISDDDTVVLSVPLDDILSTTKLSNSSFELRAKSSATLTYSCLIFEVAADDASDVVAAWTHKLACQLWPSVFTLLPKDLWASVTSHLNVESFKNARATCTRFRSSCAREHERIAQAITGSVWLDESNNVWLKQLMIRCVFANAEDANAISNQSEMFAHPLFPGLICVSAFVQGVEPDLTEELILDASTTNEKDEVIRPDLIRPGRIPSIAQGFVNPLIQVDKTEISVYESFLLKISNNVAHARLQWGLMDFEKWNELIESSGGNQPVMRVLENSLYICAPSLEKTTVLEIIVPASFVPGKYKIVMFFKSLVVRCNYVHVASAIDLLVKPHPSWSSIELESLTFASPCCLTLRHEPGTASLQHLGVYFLAKREDGSIERSSGMTMHPKRIDETHTQVCFNGWRPQYSGLELTTHFLRGAAPAVIASLSVPDPDADPKE